MCHWMAKERENELGRVIRHQTAEFKGDLVDATVAVHVLKFYFDAFAQATQK